MIEQKFDSNPETYTYQHAMNDLKKDVLRRNQPNSDGGFEYRPRRIKESNTKKKQQYKNSRYNQIKNKKNYHKDAKKITLKDGREIWFHHSFSFDSDVWRNLTDQQREAVRATRKGSRAEAKAKASNRSISQLESKLETMSKTMESFISQVQSGVSVPSQIHMFQGSQSQTPTPPSHIMGGRNEQIQRRNTGGKNY